MAMFGWFFAHGKPNYGGKRKFSSSIRLSSDRIFADEQNNQDGMLQNPPHPQNKTESRGSDGSGTDKSEALH